MRRQFRSCPETNPETISFRFLGIYSFIIFIFGRFGSYDVNGDLIHSLLIDLNSFK